jgi:hypothetical protein
MKMPHAVGSILPSRFVRTAVSLTLLTALLGGIGVVGYPTACIAAPEPDPVPKRWELNITPGPLRIMTIDDPETGPRSYFYFTYKAVNNTGDDLLFAPSFELSTDEGDLMSPGRDVPLAVTDEILRRLDNPFLKDQINVIGQIMQGEENAKEGLVVWLVPDMDVDQVTVYCKGFSGETKSIDVPLKTGGNKHITFSKQYMLRYAVPGELDPRKPAPLPVSERRWIMR